MWLSLRLKLTGDLGKESVDQCTLGLIRFDKFILDLRKSSWTDTNGPHDIDLTEGSLLARLAAGERCVNSYHLQAVKDVGEGLSVSARSTDGLIEAIETEDGQVLGVQFHPERMGDTWATLFGHLVARARG